MNKIEIKRETVSAIVCGKDVYEVAQTSDKRGVVIRNANGNVFIPVGDVGLAVAKELMSMVNVGVTKRKRRTRAEIEAEAAGN
jgi:hypothetical protein